MGYSHKLKLDALKYFETHTAKETSEFMDVPVGTLYTWTKEAGRAQIAKHASKAAPKVAPKEPPPRVDIAKDVKEVLSAMSAEKKAAAPGDSTEVARLKVEVDKYRRLYETYKTIAEEAGVV